RAPVRTHTSPCPPQDVPAIDVAVQGMEPAFGFLLGTAVQRPLQGTDLVHRPVVTYCDAFLPAGGTSRTGTHPGTSSHAARIDEAGVLRSGRVMLSRPSALLRPPPTASRQPATSRLHRL